MVPKFVMPSYMQELSLLVPHGWAIECYQDVLVKDYDIELIMPKVMVLLAFAIGFFVVGILKMKFSKSQSLL